MSHALLKVLGVALLISGSAAAAMRTAAKNDDQPQALLPHPAKGKGKHCVAPTAFMRRYHMNMLFHHRYQVVHRGIRTAQYDLTRCISCHAVKGADGKPVSYADPKHFCRSCHDYAAVKVDCFECHASVPGAPEKSSSVIGPDKFAAKGTDDKEVAALTKYLGDTKR
ncbi:MAG: hypothetical protein ACYC5H_07700 [Methylovirgula sp.]